jgi:DNA-binding response OmpR family regulator
MLPRFSQSIILAFAPNPVVAASTNLVELGPMPIQWIYDMKAMIREVEETKPVAILVVGDGDSVSSIRTCYALRRASVAPIHLISSTMSESEANLARLLGATSVLSAEAAPTALSQLIWQHLNASPQPEVSPPTNQREIAGLNIDFGRRTVRFNGVDVALTRIEFELLTLLVMAAGSVISRTELVAQVWGANWFGVENVLDTHLAHLRRKIARHGFENAIVNVRGVGFYFEPPATHELLAGH